MYLSLLGACIILLLIKIYLSYKESFRYFEKQGIPFPKPTIPFGNFWRVGFNVHFIDKINAIYRQFRGKDTLCGFFVLNRPVYLILDPGLIKHVLQTDFYHFHDRGLYHNENSDPLSAHLFCISGEKWKNLRAKFTSTLTTGKIKGMFHILTSVSDNLIGVLGDAADKNVAIDYRDMMSRYMADIIGMTAFGLDCNALKNPSSEIMRIKEFLSFQDLKYKLHFVFVNAFQNFARKLSIQVLPNYIQEFFVNVITDAVKNREENNIKRNDFLDMLIQLKNNGKLDGEEKEIGKISFSDLLAQCFVLFIAGFETSSTAISYALYELALNQDLQDKTRREIDRVLDEHGGKITYDSIVAQNYVGQIIKESLRMYTPGNVLLRKCTKTYNVPDSKRVIEEGTHVFIPMHAIHNDPEYFKNPKVFDPDRFTPEEESKLAPFTYLPFGKLVDKNLLLFCILRTS